MKQLIIDLIEVTQNGTIQIRMHKLSSDGDMIGNHRTSIAPGGDIDAQIAAVNAHMGSEGYAPIPDADVIRVKATAQATWTPELIKPFTAEVTAAIAEQATERAKVEEATAALVAAQAELEAAQATQKANAEAQAATDAANKAAAEKKAFDDAVAAEVAKQVV